MPKGITISAKMLFAFAALLALVAAIGGFAIMKIGEVNQLSAQMRSNTLPATQLIGDIHAYTSQYRIQQSGIITAPTPESKAKAEKMIRNASNAISGMMDDYEKLLSTKEQKDLFATLKTNWAQYQQQTDQLIILAQSGDAVGASAMFEGESLDMFYTVEDSILQLIDLNQKSGQAISAKSESIYADSRRMLIGAVGLGLVITLLLSGILMQTIAKPVKKMAGSVALLVDGDLSVEIHGIREPRERVMIMERNLAVELNPDAFQSEWQPKEKDLSLQIDAARKIVDKVTYTRRDLLYIASLTSSLNVDGHRADLVILKTARAQAAFDGRLSLSERDIALAAELALPHRMKKQPFQDSVMNPDQLQQNMRQARAEAEQNASESDETMQEEGGQGQADPKKV